MLNTIGVKENYEDKDQEKNKKKVVIIGNGFDISVGLKSSYQSFIEYIKDSHHFSNDLELYGYNRLFLRKYENFNLNWSDFESLYEETVRKINNRELHEDLQGSFEITGINEAITALEKEFYEYISDEYQKWIQQNIAPQYGSEFKRFSKKINPFIKELIQDESAFFINFNYTNTLEDLCEDVLYDSSDEGITASTAKIRKAKERIAHIHGSIEDDNILFGGGFADREDTKQIHYSKSLLNDKLFRIKENDKLNTTRKNIMKILEDKHADFDLYIIGHSLHGSDFPFLSKALNDAKRVFIFYYESDYTNKMEEIIREIGSATVGKIILVPFIEILFEDQLVIDNYVDYETIAPFLNNKFPKEKMLKDLSLTAQHFVFKNITELKITDKNAEIVINLIENLKANKISTRIKKICSSGISGEYFDKIKGSKAFIEILTNVEKFSFENTEIDVDIIDLVLRECGSLVHVVMNHCVFLNNNKMKVDISVCETLKRIELVDCIFNFEKNEEKVIFSSSQDNNLEKLVIEKNTNIILEQTILENAKNLIELSIVFSDTDTEYVEGHLENLEILRIDCSATNFPKITIGNEIKEITIIGYPEETFKFSSLMKSNENSLGFPKLKLFQLNSPDTITSFSDLNIDVLLDVFSKNIKLIIDEKNISIDEYYNKYKNAQIDPFLRTTKKVVEQTLTSIIHSENKIEKKVISEFEEWYTELSELINNSDNENSFLSLVKNQLNISKIYETEIQDGNIEQTNLLNSTLDNEKNIVYSEIDHWLFEYVIQEKTREEIINFLNNAKKKSIVVDVYKDIVDLLSQKKLSQDEVVQLKEKQFENKKLDILKEFSIEWFVSIDELILSSIQYKLGMNSIPNIKAIIESKKYDEYKKFHLEAKPFRYAQSIKLEWRRVLDEIIIPLVDELR